MSNLELGNVRTRITEFPKLPCCDVFGARHLICDVFQNNASSVFFFFFFMVVGMFEVRDVAFFLVGGGVCGFFFSL